MRKFLQSTAGKAILLAGCLIGGYEANEHWHLIGGQSAQPGSWFAPSTVSSQSTEFTVKSAYQTPAGRVLLGSTEDYLDPQCQTVVVPSSLAKARNIDAGCVGKTIRVTGNRSTYKGRPQLVAASIEVK